MEADEAAAADQQHHAMWRRMLQFLRRPRAVRWFRILCWVSGVHFLTWAAVGGLLTDGSYQPSVGPWVLRAMAAGLPVALVVGVLAHYRLKDPKLSNPRLPRRKWRGDAVGEGVALGGGVLLAGVWIFVAVMAPLQQTQASSILLGRVLLLACPLLAVWAGVARYSLQMDMLATAAPPELQRAFELRDRLAAFRSGADAFERAVQEAAVVVQQMEDAIEEQGRRLSEAHDEYQRHLRLSERARRQAVMYQRFSKEELACYPDH